MTDGQTARFAMAKSRYSSITAVARNKMKTGARGFHFFFSVPFIKFSSCKFILSLSLLRKTFNANEDQHCQRSQRIAVSIGIFLD